ncbi:hypothetical protein [Microbispora sp. NPDC049125]|uniref:hypothetical protein n=1 Tax=Microbispora sp. NPDC049125 TaxID=3154929 RepID=UPI00346616C9
MSGVVGDREFVRLDFALDFMEEDFGVTQVRANEWLQGAVLAGAVHMVEVVEGRGGWFTILQFKPDTTGDDETFMTTLIDGLDVGPVGSGLLGADGKVHMLDADERSRPGAPEAAPGGSVWVTTAERFAAYVTATNAANAAARAAKAADHVVEDAHIDLLCGEALARIRGLLHMAGHDPSFASAYLSDKNSKVILTVNIGGQDVINAIGEVLRNAGVSPYYEEER